MVAREIDSRCAASSMRRSSSSWSRECVIGGSATSLSIADPSCACVLTPAYIIMM